MHRKASGTFQTCKDIETGIVLAMTQLYDDEECEADLVTNADNALNRLNRKL